jgi:hypothetical protein
MGRPAHRLVHHGVELEAALLHVEPAAAAAGAWRVLAWRRAPPLLRAFAACACRWRAPCKRAQRHAPRQVLRRRGVVGVEHARDLLRQLRLRQRQLVAGPHVLARWLQAGGGGRGPWGPRGRRPRRRGAATAGRGTPPRPGQALTGLPRRTRARGHAGAAPAQTRRRSAAAAGAHPRQAASPPWPSSCPARGVGAAGTGRGRRAWRRRHGGAAGARVPRARRRRRRRRQRRRAPRAASLRDTDRAPRPSAPRRPTLSSLRLIPATGMAWESSPPSRGGWEGIPALSRTLWRPSIGLVPPHRRSLTAISDRPLRWRAQIDQPTVGANAL